jgi:hypothetical protein
VRSQAQRDRRWGLVVLEPQLRVLVRLASALARLLAAEASAEASARCVQTADLPVALVADSEEGCWQGAVVSSTPLAAPLKCSRCSAVED